MTEAESKLNCTQRRVRGSRQSENRTCFAVGRNSCIWTTSVPRFAVSVYCIIVRRAGWPAVTLIPLSATILPITVSQDWPRLRAQIASFNTGWNARLTLRPVVYNASVPSAPERGTKHVFPREHEPFIRVVLPFLLALWYVRSVAMLLCRLSPTATRHFAAIIPTSIKLPKTIKLSKTITSYSISS